MARKTFSTIGIIIALWVNIAAGAAPASQPTSRASMTPEQWFRVGCAVMVGTPEIPKDPAKAVYCFVKAAEAGHADAQMQLGMCYFHGTGVTQNHKEAAYWFAKAAKQGNAVAEQALAVCYATGEGVEKSDKQAIEWTAKAADDGIEECQFQIAVRYWLGDGVEKDGALAYKWANLAAASGLEDAVKLRDTLDTNLSDVQIAQGQRLAREWREKHRAKPTTK